jgi:hypothetical protein
MTVWLRKRTQAINTDSFRIYVLPASGLPETIKGW